MAPRFRRRRKETIVYYDFVSDVLACASTLSSSSVGSEERDDSGSFSPRKQRQKQRQRHQQQEKTQTLSLPLSTEQILSKSFSSSCPSLDLSYNLHPFDLNQYENQVHQWDQKPFVVKTLTTLGCPRRRQLDKMVHRTRAKLSRAGCWDGLVLTDTSNPLQTKIYWSVQNVERVPNHVKMEHLSGTWLSKVFVGDPEDLMDWVDHVCDQVQEKYQWTGPRHWFAFYPTELQPARPKGQLHMCFFIKVSA